MRSPTGEGSGAAGRLERQADFSRSISRALSFLTLPILSPTICASMRLAGQGRRSADPNSASVCSALWSEVPLAPVSIGDR